MKFFYKYFRFSIKLFIFLTVIFEMILFGPIIRCVDLSCLSVVEWISGVLGDSGSSGGQDNFISPDQYPTRQLLDTVGDGEL